MMQEAIRIAARMPTPFQRSIERKFDEWVTQDRAFARPGIDERCWITNGEQSTWKDADRLLYVPYGYHGLQVFDDPHTKTLALRCRRKDLPPVDPTFPETNELKDRLRSRLILRDYEKRKAKPPEPPAKHLPGNDQHLQQPPDPIPPRVKPPQINRRVQRLNQATQEMIEQAKAAVIAKEEEARQQKQRRAEAAQARKESAAKRRMETMERIRKDNAAKQVTTATHTTRPDRPSLTPEQLSQIGSKIEGSSLFRDFCRSCGEAMRVTDPGIPNTCLSCKPTGCPGVSHSTIVSSGIEYHGGRFHSAEW